MREVRGWKVTMSKKPVRVTVSDEHGMLATMNVLLSDEDIESLPRRPTGYGLSRVSLDRHFFSLPQESPLWIEGSDVLCAWVRPYAVFRASLRSLYASRSKISNCPWTKDNRRRCSPLVRIGRRRRR